MNQTIVRPGLSIKLQPSGSHCSTPTPKPRCLQTTGSTGFIVSVFKYSNDKNLLADGLKCDGPGGVCNVVMETCISSLGQVYVFSFKSLQWEGGRHFTVIDWFYCRNCELFDDVTTRAIGKTPEFSFQSGFGLLANLGDIKYKVRRRLVALVTVL